jgi:hypothetical protein
MTTDTVAASTDTQRKPEMSANRKEELLHDLALNPLPVKVIASMYGITYQYARLLKSQNKEKIAEIKADAEAIRIEEAGKAMADLWILDPQNRYAIRQGALVKILEKQQALEHSTDIWEQEHWAKLETLKHQILRYLEDSAGQLPTRSQPVPDQGKITYEIPGVDLGQVVKDWEQPVEAPK